MTRRTRVQRSCLALAALAGGVAALLRATDGFDASILGISVTAHEPRRPLLFAVLFLVGYFLAGGRVWRPTAAQMIRVMRAISPPVVAAVVIATVFVVAVVYGSRTVGGSDSYGYVSQAHLWLKGNLKQPQVWTADVPWPDGAATFTPLGYSRKPTDTTLAPVYSAGLPMLMAIAMMIGGACAAFVITPLAGALAVFATYRLGRAVASSAWVGAIAAWLLATSPTFLYAVVQPMSDVPVTAMWMLAFVLAWRGTTTSAVLAGVATAWAVLIRVNLAPLAAVLLVWYAVLGWRARREVSRAWWPPLAYAAMSAIGMTIAGLLNWYLHGSPFLSGYGSNADLFGVENVAPNFQRYVAWLNQTQTPLVWVGVAALFLPVRRVWGRDANLLMVACMAVFTFGIWIAYLLYIVFDAWWFLRFLLPVFPLVFVALGRVAVTAAGTSRILQVAVAVAIIALGANGIRLAYNGYAFDLRESTAQFFTAARVVRAVTEPTSVILSMQHSGSLRHYAGRLTLRYDFLGPGWLDAAVDWLSAHDIRTYALLDGIEVDAWRERFAGQRLGNLDFRPIREFEGSSRMALYDLLAPGAGSPRRVMVSRLDMDCHPPAEVPMFPLAISAP